MDAFEGVFRYTKLMQQYCSFFNGISKALYLHLDYNTVYFYTQRKEYQAWAQISIPSLFLEANLEEPIELELSAESLAKALESDTGNRVALVVQKKTNKVVRVAVKFDGQTNASLSIRQKLFASLENQCIPPEPQMVNGMYAKLKGSILNQVAMVSERYKGVASHVHISLSRGQGDTTTTLTLRCLCDGCIISTSVDLTSVSVVSSQDSDEEDAHGEMTCTVRAKDWCHMLAARRMTSELVLGIVDEQMLGLFSQTENESMTMYLAQTLA